MTEYIAIPLSILLNYCYLLFGNMILAIILFTFFTKVILFPVSVWVQKNSIKMVQLTPQLNQLKMAYFGDKDAIAEKQQELYKREGYHPILSTIPMFIQIFLLIGVIGAVRRMTAGAESWLSIYPAHMHGIMIFAMPMAAGLAAVLLGFAQNRLNPLQREQTRISQLGTNGFSVAVSLVLGAFVPMGVGLYWVFSNLFTILQQMLLNVVVPPEKHINYEALVASKKELEQLNALGGKISSEDKKREKTDYKRFFSIANKHLVFYSEKSGFYKYYQNVIEYLINNSNVTIHYVTSDPNDQVFKLSQSQPRIKPYYIGEKKLITLMMKMDADIVVMTMTNLDNFHIKRSYVKKDVEYVYIHHYPLSTTMIFNKGSFDNYDTVFCTGEFQFDELRQTEELYGLKPRKLIAAGYCALEQMQKKYDTMDITDREHKKILIAPSWHPHNILDSCIDDILSELLGKGYEVVVRPHPEYVKRYGVRMQTIVERYKNYSGGDLSFELDFSKADSLIDSDMVISDWSGAAYEFAYVTLKPVIFINTPPKVYNTEYDRLKARPLEFTLRDQVGIQIEISEIKAKLLSSVCNLIEQRAEYKDIIRTVREKNVFNYGNCAKVCGSYIIDSIVDKHKK